MTPNPTTAATTEPGRAEDVLVVVDDRWTELVHGEIEPALSAAAEPLSGRRVTLLRATELAEGPGAGVHLLEDDIVSGGVPGPGSILAAALREADRRGPAALALVAANGACQECTGLPTLLGPVLDDGYDFVCPSYRRGRFDGMLGTALVYPLTRAVYGQRLRQPMGGEAVMSGALARELLSDPDWERDPLSAGSDAWLIAKVLSSRRRVSQAWVDATRAARGDGEASRAVIRMIGPLFREMERYADDWQRIDGSVPVDSFGEKDPPDERPAHIGVESLVAAFRLGVGELDGVWGLVLSPTTRLALRRAAASADERVRVEDTLWVRIVYDFAVGWSTRAVERRHLLASLTPIYLGWVAGFVRDVRELDRAGTEARVEALCRTFEREKRYLIKRWRWPDGFNP